MKLNRWRKVGNAYKALFLSPINNVKVFSVSQRKCGLVFYLLKWGHLLRILFCKHFPWTWEQITARENAHLYFCLKMFGLKSTPRWRSAVMPRLHYSEEKAWGKISTSAEADRPSWSNWKLSAWQRLTFSFSGKSAGSACVFNHHNRGGKSERHGVGGIVKIWCRCIFNHQVALWDCLKYSSPSTGKIMGLEY